MTRRNRPGGHAVARWPAATLLAAVLAAGPAPASDANGRVDAARRPNFVVIFCDDLGYGDLGCYGSRWNQTPEIDRMASQGVRFTSFYAGAPVCTPSRAALLLGSYARRVDLDLDNEGQPVFFPREPKGIAPSEVTLAEALADAGYQTACVGKWHLGDQPPHLPTRHGFGYWFGVPYSNDMEWAKRGDPPLPLMENDRVIEQHDAHREFDQSTLTQRYTEAALDWLEANKSEPFFLYLAHTMPHNPVAAREAFYERTTNPEAGFGAAVAEIDWSTGRLLEWLRDNDLASDTLVIFTSDNGGQPRWGADNGPLRGHKAQAYEGGVRVPCVAWRPGTVPAGRETDAMASVLDLAPTLCNLAGATLPAGPTRDGHDIGDLLEDPGKSLPPRPFFVWYDGRLEAVRYGDWKLMLPGEFRRREQELPELYNLVTDLGEQHDLAAQQPQIVAELTALADEHRRQLGERLTYGPTVRRAARVDDPRPLLTDASANQPTTED
ncbi:sulfatase [Botrimarina sp.]|uniref:sulfatase family protein n=1 Tax=Botrimarina sp. TaxID=2795802 RepID=UPI0032EF6D5D